MELGLVMDNKLTLLREEGVKFNGRAVDPSCILGIKELLEIKNQVFMDVDSE